MSVFDNKDKDDLEYEIETFLEKHTISELMQIISYCIKIKEQSED